MQDQLKMQDELKKIIANSTVPATSIELSDEELEAVAGGEARFVCTRRSKTQTPKLVCVNRTREYGGKDLV